jgi:hypothetical protein
MVAVSILTSTKSCDPILQSVARNMWLFEASINCSIQFKHIKCARTNIADLLSRWSSRSNPVAKLFYLLGQVSIWIRPMADALFLDPNIKNLFFILFMFAEFPPQLQCFAERVKWRLQQA